MRQLGINVRFIGASSWQTQTFIDTAGPAAEGSIVATSLPTNEELGAKGSEYLAAYGAANFKEPPDVYGPFGYAAGQLLVEAIKRFGPERKAIADGFRSLKDVDTIFGKMSVDPDGEVQPKLVTFAILEKGKFVAFIPGKSGK
jgi:branched-chain amino acid transport system substrate-binding protein